jgi:hypothetical protein
VPDTVPAERVPPEESPEAEERERERERESEPPEGEDEALRFMVVVVAGKGMSKDACADGTWERCGEKPLYSTTVFNEEGEAPEFLVLQKEW